MHDSTMHGVVLFPRKKLCLKDTASHGRMMCFRTVASATIGGTNNHTIPAEQDAESVGYSIRLQDELCRDAEAAGSPTGSDTLTIHSEVQLKPNAATRPRVFGTLIADAGHYRSSNSNNEEELGRGLVRNRHQKLQKKPRMRIRKYRGMTLRKQRGASLLEVLSADDGLPISGALGALLTEGRRRGTCTSRRRRGRLPPWWSSWFIVFFWDCRLGTAKGYLQLCSSCGRGSAVTREG